MKKKERTIIAEDRKGNIILYLFIFSMLFSFEIAGYNMRYVVLTCWTLYSLKTTRKIYMNTSLMLFPMTLFLIIIYSMITATFYGTYNSFEVLRSARALLTYSLILLFLSSGKYSLKQIISAFSLVLFSHAISIIIGVLLPSFKEMILPISQYHKEFMSIRSSGLLSGYDDAGYLCIVGFVLRLVRNSLYKRKLVDAHALVFMIAVMFTSRFNIAGMAVTILIIFLFNIKIGNMKGVINISKYLLGFGVFSVITWALTTAIGIGMRSQLFELIPILNNIYSVAGSSYTDYGIHTSTIFRHMNINSLETSHIFFGGGIRNMTTDVGYIKTIYSIGVIGVIVQIFTFFKASARMKMIKRKSPNVISINTLVITFISAVILMLVMETKSSFIFSSTTFEMLSFMYIASELTSINAIRL